jgi:hypothetical protein
LAGKSHSCFSFNLNREIDLELAFSFTHLQIMDKQIATSIALNDKPYSAVATPHLTLTVANMVEQCAIGTKVEGFPTTCKISVNF